MTRSDTSYDGGNILGKIWMKIRDRLAGAQPSQAPVVRTPVVITPPTLATTATSPSPARSTAARALHAQPLTAVAPNQATTTGSPARTQPAQPRAPASTSRVAPVPTGAPNRSAAQPSVTRVQNSVQRPSPAARVQPAPRIAQIQDRLAEIRATRTQLMAQIRALGDETTQLQMELVDLGVSDL